jgi:hypothetical protein
MSPSIRNVIDKMQTEATRILATESRFLDPHAGDRWLLNRHPHCVATGRNRDANRIDVLAQLSMADRIGHDLRDRELHVVHPLP